MAETTPNQAEETAADGTTAVQVGLLFSGLRCILTYAVIPGMALASGARDSTTRLSVGLQVLGAIVSVYGSVRLWSVHSPWRWAYSGLAVLVVGLAVYDLTTRL